MNFMNTAERRLVVVTDVFGIAGKATCVSPVVPHELIELTKLRPGDHLELRRPDGSTLTIALKGLEWPSPGKGGLIICVEPTITKAEIPVGTEIWKVELQ